MNNNIEIEAKVLLTKEQYVKVMKDKGSICTN